MKRLLTILMLALVPVAPLFAQAGRSAADRLEAERVEQSGTVITIIFDDSGSMQERGKLGQAKAAFQNWIRQVPPEHRLSLIALNRGILVPPGRDNRAEVLRAVADITANGQTPLVQTIRSAIEQVEARRKEVGPYERQIIVVFTDGQDTSSEGNPGVQRMLEAARAKGVETVGIGFQGEGDYMSKNATRYYNASNARELENSLAKVDAEIGDTSDVVIDDATLAQMKNVTAADLPAPGAATETAQQPVQHPAQHPAAAPQRAPGFRIKWFVVAIVVFVFLRVLRAVTKKL